MAKILVTGATGFIGRSLCGALRSGNHDVVEVSTKDGDIADSTCLRRFGAVSHVFHLAGRTFVPDSWENPLEFHRVNVLGTINILEFCRRVDAGLTFVSAYLYGAPCQLPVSEACLPQPNNPYALSKYLADQACEFYAAHYGLGVTVIRPFNIFGPDQRSHFLIPHILRQVRTRQTIRVKDLTPRRDYVYIKDLVDALEKTLRRTTGCNVVNIGSGYSISVSELIATIQSIAGTHLPVVSEGEVRPNEIMDVYADITKARNLLGWAPKVSLLQGLESTMGWEK